MTTFRIPALVTSNKGTLIAVCDARVDQSGDLPNNIDLVMRKSFNNGKTWTLLKKIVDFPGTEGAADGSLLVDRETGSIWLFYVYAPEGIGWKQSKPGLDGPTFQLHLLKSENDGETWHPAAGIRYGGQPG